MTLNWKRISPWLWGGLWLVLMSGALLFRPILPVDETRYLSVAWEMWLRDDYLVPHLNGATYSHKPPLLFWLINAGWGIFGVSDWWPRLVAPTFGLGCLYLTARLGKRLWPDHPIHLMAPFLLVGTFYWAIYTTLTMFDLIMCFWTLLGLHGLLDVLNGKNVRGWCLFAFAIGMGVLSKGPVTLVYLLPAGLFAPYWCAAPLNAVKWYAGLILATVSGALLALGWAIPAGFSGGEDYRNAIFWGQSAGRVVGSFAHGKPFWWYLAVLPGLVLPWVFWPTLWKTAWQKARSFRTAESSVARSADRGIRLTLIWSVATIVILSAVSGKRPHYLLPMFPALALLVSYLIVMHAQGHFIRGRLDVLPFALVSLLLATALLFAPEIGAAADKSVWVDPTTRVWSGPLFLITLVLLWRPPQEGISRVLSIAATSAATIWIIHGVASPSLSRAYDMRPVATYVADQQKQGIAVANFGKYHGQFNFLGRLTKPLAVTGQGNVVNWLKDHPRAKIISYYDKFKAQDKPEFMHPFRSKTIAVWDRATILAYPLVATRNSEGQRLSAQK